VKNRIPLKTGEAAVMMYETPVGNGRRSKRAEQLMAMQLLTEKQVSALTAIPMGTLRRWRCVGDGPPFIKMGRGPKARVKYDAIDILAYVEAGRRYPIRAGITEGQHGNYETR
jgi:hypothetical protein